MSYSILVSNYNSGPAIELCIESIRKYTKDRPPDRLIIANDLSRHGTDEAYLRACRDKGWIELYENETGKLMTHGGCLNRLLNEVCDTDHAAVLDCDIQILAPGWAEQGLAMLADDVLGICDYRHEAISDQGWCTGFYRAWFMFLNMKTYRDEMQVDWRFSYEDATKWPYNQMFGYLSAVPKSPRFNPALACNDPGSQLWVKIRYYNPKGYRMLDVPHLLFAKYRHFGHTCVLQDIPDEQMDEATRRSRNLKIAMIEEELHKLRCRP